MKAERTNVRVNQNNQTMDRKVIYIALSLLTVLFFCCLNENSEKELSGDNQLLLNKIKMEEYRGKKKEAELIAETLKYDKDKGEIIITEGIIQADILAGSLKDKTDIFFERGVYNFKSKNMKINLKGGLLIDKGIKITAINLELKTDEGYINALNDVKIRGENFEFEGEGFSGNIKDGIFVFEKGVRARIF